MHIVEKKSTTSVASQSVPASRAAMLKDNRDRQLASSLPAVGTRNPSTEAVVIQAIGPIARFKRFIARQRRRRNPPAQNQPRAAVQAPPQAQARSVFTAADIAGHTHVTKENEPSPIAGVNGPFKRIETFNQRTTGDNYDTPKQEQLNFDNLYNDHTWIMQNNFRAPSRAEGFHASDIIDAQVRAAGLPDDHIPEQIIRHNVINDAAHTYFSNNPNVLGPWIDNQNVIQQLVSAVPNIRSANHILHARHTTIQSIQITPLTGNEYRITIRPTQRL